MGLASEEYSDAATSLGKTKKFTVSVKIQDHPGKLKVGYTPLVLIRTLKCPCKITKIISKVTKANQKAAKKKEDLENMKEFDAKFIQKGDIADLEFEPQMPMCCQAMKDCEGLGRVAILESNSLVMMGKIRSVENEKVNDR